MTEQELSGIRMSPTPEQQRRRIVERPPLPADATPIGRDWVEYAKSLLDQLEQAQARERGLREAARALIQARADGANIEPWGALVAAVEASDDGQALAAQSEGSET